MPIRVLIADDSPVLQRSLAALFADDPEVQIIGTASDGLEAVRLACELKPDLVTMDIFMPGIDGLEATRRIMASCPTRIVIISAMAAMAEQLGSFEALRAGALEIIEKPQGILTGNYQAMRAQLLGLVRRIAETRLRTSEIPIPSSVARSREETGRTTTGSRDADPHPQSPRIIVIGGSTGAPPVLAEILGALPADFPVPILIGQHISKGFVGAMARWLATATALSVSVAQEGASPGPGQVWLAPDDRLVELDEHGRIRQVARQRAGRCPHTPCLDILLGSAARAHRRRVLGVLLSGMGKDGAEGLLAIRQAGGLTVGQSEPSCVVYGMPDVARGIGACEIMAEPREIFEIMKRSVIGELP